MMQELIEQAYRRKLKKYGGDVSDELAMLLIEEATKEVILMEAVSSGKDRKCTGKAGGRGICRCRL